MLKRLRSNKGFSMVELLVVIAIIAIMIAAVFVNFNLLNSKRSAIITYAETFFYNTQSAMAELKSNDVALPVDVKDDNAFLVYVTTDINGDISAMMYTDLNPSNSAAKTMEGADCSLSPAASNLRKSLSEFKEKGTFVALVDKHYRVIKAFFSYATIDEIKVKDYTFTADDYIGDHLTGAYPVSESAAGCLMTA